MPMLTLIVMWRVTRGELERRHHDVEDPLGHQLRPDGERLTVDQHDELVAPEPSDGVPLAEDAGQPVGHQEEQLVTRRVAEGVVDVLEVVEIQEEGGHRGVLAPEPQHHLLEPVEDERPVRAAR